MQKQFYELKIDEALKALTDARDSLGDEITSYPTPISGCDQQYIRLISDRTRISQAIHKLNQHPFVATPRMLEEATA